MFKVIIAGGRGFNNYEYLKAKVSSLLQNKNDVTIISGCARGADALGAKYAKENNIELIKIPANWNKYGKSAGYRRNVEMANIANGLIAFWDGKSRGTKHMIDIAKSKNIPTRIINY